MRHASAVRGNDTRARHAAEAALKEHLWPGNIRELEHAVHSACLLAAGPEIGAELLPDEIRLALRRAFQELTNAELKAACERPAGEAEREFVAALMERHGGNISQAARAAGMQRRRLQRLLAKHRAEAGR